MSNQPLSASIGQESDSKKIREWDSLGLLRLKSEISTFQASQKDHLAQEKLAKIKVRYYAPLITLTFMSLLTVGIVGVTKLLDDKKAISEFATAKIDIVKEIKQLQVDTCKIRIQKNNEKLFISIDQLTE